MISSINTLKDLKNLALLIKNKVKQPYVIHLNGTLGAGKTTFVKYFAKALDIKENITSPTYSLMNIHENDGTILIHIDMYRIKNELEIDMLGLDYLPSNAIYCIEWAYPSDKTPKANLILNFKLNEEQRSCELIFVNDNNEN